MQPLNFSRRLHVSLVKCKDLSKFIKKGGKMNTLVGSPTIYNPVNSASNYKGFMRAKIEPGLYFQKAQSSQTGSINSETIPSLFMAKDDPRLSIAKNLEKLDVLKAENAPSLLKSRSGSKQEGKTYHLTPADVNEIKRLRASNPEKYTPKALANKYDCSVSFILTVAPASNERKEEMQTRLNLIKSKWNPKRAIAREDRKKRMQFWYRA